MPPRGFAPSLAKLIAALADYHLAALGPWRRARRDGVLIVERGWFDHAVDPLRYRLHPKLAAFSAWLGRFVRPADLVALLCGESRALCARKPELERPELERQIDAWRRLAPQAGRRVIALDTVAASPDACAAKVLAPRRLDLRLRPGPSADAALGLYRPLRPRAAWAARANRHLVRAGLVRGAPAPFDSLDDLARTLHVNPDAISSFVSSAPGRRIVGFAAGGKLVAVAKVGRPDDAGLRREAEALARLQTVRAPFTVARLRWHGLWQERYVLALDAVEAPRPESADLEQALEIAAALARPLADGRSVTHGDFAPWNIIATADGPVVIDWERSRTPHEPLFDLAHFVVQSGSHLGRWSANRAVELLIAPGGPGCRYLRAIGESATRAPEFLRRYLEQTAADRALSLSKSFRRAMRELLE
jgi:hypothetical protein